MYHFLAQICSLSLPSLSDNLPDILSNILGCFFALEKNVLGRTVAFHFSLMKLWERVNKIRTREKTYGSSLLTRGNSLPYSLQVVSYFFSYFVLLNS